VLAPKRFNAPASENGYEKPATAFFDSFELINVQPPNKSLDASGGSVFRIMTGPAMVD
jgi:hypothetical protein